MTILDKIRKARELVAAMDAAIATAEDGNCTDEDCIAECDAIRDARLAALALLRDDELLALGEEVERLRADYMNACGTVAQMHSAAVGTFGEGPRRGVVEDVEDVRLRAEAFEAKLAAVTQQAQQWKGEAECQASIVRECYEICTGKTGEPGDWNGAAPVRAMADKLAAAEARANLYEARYCRVRDLHNTFQHYVDGELVRVDKIDDTVYDASIDGLIADAQEQIDAAMQSKPDQETGAGE